jgi:hypothetical protein
MKENDKILNPRLSPPLTIQAFWVKACNQSRPPEIVRGMTCAGSARGF